MNEAKALRRRIMKDVRMCLRNRHREAVQEIRLAVRHAISREIGRERREQEARDLPPQGRPYEEEVMSFWSYKCPDGHEFEHGISRRKDEAIVFPEEVECAACDKMAKVVV